MKKLLILGANPETANLVRIAQDMGVYTIVTDNIPNSYAKGVADEAWDIDGMDIETLVAEIKKKNVAGVLVGTADPLIPSYYKICKKLELPCYVTEKSLEVFTNKRKLIDAGKKYGIYGIPEYTLDEIRKDRNVQYPVLIKPVDGRSGKGISVCNTKEEVETAIEKAKKYSMCKDVLIQRYMECDDVILYYTFSDEQVFLTATADRFTCKEQVGLAPIVLGGVYPSKHTQLYLSTMHDRFCQFFKNLEIENGILMLQVFVEDGKFYVYDPGFRLQGGAPHIIVNAINGFDHQKMLVNYALTGKMGLEELVEKNDYTMRGKIGASQVVLLKKGIIKSIIGIEEVKKLDGVVHTTQRLYEGDEVYIEGSEQQVLVRFHIVCNSIDELNELVNEINTLIHVLDEEGCEMCLGGLQPEWFRR